MRLPDRSGVPARCWGCSRHEQPYQPPQHGPDPCKDAVPWSRSSITAEYEANQWLPSVPFLGGFLKEAHQRAQKNNLRLVQQVDPWGHDQSVVSQ